MGGDLTSLTRQSKVLANYYYYYQLQKIMEIEEPNDLFALPSSRGTHHLNTDRAHLMVLDFKFSKGIPTILVIPNFEVRVLPLVVYSYRVTLILKLT